MGGVILSKTAKTLLCWVLISTCILPAQVFATGRSPIARPSVTPGVRQPSAFQTQLSQAWEDPFLSALQTANDMPLQAPLTHTDPSLDADPFFMRAQEWVDAQQVPVVAGEKLGRNAVTGLSDGFVTSDGAVYVSLRGAPRFLKLTAPLMPVLFTDTHVFFSLNKNSDLFEKKSESGQTDAAGNSAPGEGVFFISRAEMLKASAHGQAAPVYFFPMPGSGWRGATRAFQLLNEELVVFESTEGDLLPVQEFDIEQMQQAQLINYSMAVGTAFRSAALTNQKLSDDTQILPPKNSTAGFGILFTGFDADSSTEAVFSEQATKNLWEKLKGFSFVSKATAGFSDDPMLQKRLLRVATVVVITFIASIVLKYTVFKKHFAQQRAKLGDNPTTKQKLKAEVDAIGSIFSHGLMTISQFASVWFGNAIEFLGDRFAPSLMSGQNSLVRKFLVNTVFFVRDASKKIPVNLKVWLLGGLVFGATDTFIYYLQLYYVGFWVGQAIADHVPALRQRALDAFEESNQDTARLREYEVLATGTSYLTSGAFWFSADLQNQQIKMVEGEVEKAMMGQGLNPSLPQNTAEKERRVRENLEAELKKAGLPGSESFLFDAHSLWESLFRFLGYDVPAVAPTGPQSANAYFAKSRPGLLIPSVKRALEQAKKLARQAELENNPKQEQFVAAVSILQETLNKLRTMNVFVRAPKAVLFPGTVTGASGLKGARQRLEGLLKDFISTRQQMVALSYEGSFDEEIRNIPSQWTQKIGEPGAKVAANIFRASMNSYLTGDLSVLPSPPKDYVKKEEPVKKPKVSKMALWQEKKIFAQTQARFTKTTGEPFELETARDGQKKLWNSLYAESYMNQFGLYPEYDAELIVKENLEELALARVTQKVSADPRLKQLLDGLEPAAREIFYNQMFAEALVGAYLSDVSNPKKATAISPAQPGRFQKLRQTKFRNSKALTRIARAVEAVWPEHRVKPGLNAWLDRNLPGFADFKLANERAYRASVTGAIAGYWFSKYFWLNALSPAMWLMSLVFRFTLSAPTQFLNRAFRMQGIQPMAKVQTVMVFAFVFTWATFWGAIPQQLFAADFIHAWDWGAEQVEHCKQLLTGTEPPVLPPGESPTAPTQPDHQAAPRVPITR